MKHWPRQFSSWLAISAGAALAVEVAWLEVARRAADRQALQWRLQLRQSEEMAEASPARTPQNEQAMADELRQLRREVPALRADLFSQLAGPRSEVSPDGRIDAYFDIAALMVRLRAAAAAANVI